MDTGSIRAGHHGLSGLRERVRSARQSQYGCRRDGEQYKERHIEQCTLHIIEHP